MKEVELSVLSVGSYITSFAILHIRGFDPLSISLLDFWLALYLMS